MNIRVFWNIFLKVLGIWLIVESLNIFMQSISFFAMYSANPNSSLLENLYPVIAVVIMIIFYFLILKLFVFNANWIIDRLKLDKGYDSDIFDLNGKLSTIIAVATILVGGFTFLQAFPMFCKQVFAFFQNKAIIKDNLEFGSVIYFGVKSLAAWLLMTNSKTVVKYIEKQMKKDPDTTDIN